MAADLVVRELDWAPGNYQWECRACSSVGNVTPPMLEEPQANWHMCPRGRPATP